MKSPGGARNAHNRFAPSSQSCSRRNATNMPADPSRWLMRDHGRAKYDREGCRCDICRQANRDYSRRMREQRKARRPEPQTDIPTQGEWRNKAACRQHPLDWWFGDSNETVAIQICRRCPVRTDCLRYSLEFSDLHGIWAGLTQRQRRTLQLRIAK